MGWGVHDYPEPPPEPPAATCPVCGAECQYLYRRLCTDDILGCDECVVEEDANDY